MSSDIADFGVSHDGAMTRNAEDVVRQGINLLATAVSNCAHSHGWWPEPPTVDDGTTTYINTARNMGEMIALMHSELSEALEAHRNSEPYLWYSHTFGAPTGPEHELASEYMDRHGKLGKPEGIATEFADCIIRILDTCHTLNIPVTQALIDKANYNRTRPFRHGGKTC